MAEDRILELLRELPEDGEEWSGRKAATFDVIATEAERRGDQQLAREAPNGGQAIQGARRQQKTASVS